MVVRKSDAGGVLNDRLGTTLNGNRSSRLRKILKRILSGVLVLLAVSLAVSLHFRTG